MEKEGARTLSPVAPALLLGCCCASSTPTSSHHHPSHHSSDHPRLRSEIHLIYLTSYSPHVAALIHPIFVSTRPLSLPSVSIATSGPRLSPKLSPLPTHYYPILLDHEFLLRYQEHRDSHLLHTRCSRCRILLLISACNSSIFASKIDQANHSPPAPISA